MYDNYSTNNSVEVAKDLDMEVRTFGIEGELNDLEYLKVKNHCWKEARSDADYVIVCDVDEFLYHHQMKEMLALCKKNRITMPLIDGYDMISNQLPKDSMFEIKNGLSSRMYSKQIIFDPNAIDEINFEPGAHNNHAEGEIKRGGYFKMLHYRNIGGEIEAENRHEKYLKRLSHFNRNTRYGREYRASKEDVIEQWRNNYQDAKEIDFESYPFSMHNFLKLIKPSKP